ncbi:MAG: D-sedoheptulose-7-phosphate isomerase [Bryobacteraceae bacterium]
MNDDGERSGAGGLEELYPFLYAKEGDIEKVVGEVRASTAHKAGEIVSLRETAIAALSDQMLDCGEAMARVFTAGGRLFSFGNGGSATDAHAVTHCFLSPTRGLPLPAISLAADSAVITALGNDIGFEMVFARQLSALGSSGDIALGLSTSGNSRNSLNAFEAANRRGMMTIGMAGYDGGQMAEAGTIDFLFVVPSPSVHRIQEVQTTIYHMLWELTQAFLDPASEA